MRRMLDDESCGGSRTATRWPRTSSAWTTFAFFQRVQRETDGTFGAEVIDLAGNERRIFCLMHVHAKRADKTLDQDVVNIWKLHPETGKVVERQFFMEDLAASDEFWAN